MLTEKTKMLTEMWNADGKKNADGHVEQLFKFLNSLLNFLKNVCGARRLKKKIKIIPESRIRTNPEPTVRGCTDPYSVAHLNPTMIFRTEGPMGSAKIYLLGEKIKK